MIGWALLRQDRFAGSIGGAVRAARAWPLGGICGTALWVSFGVLDAYTGASGPTRVAMLPSLGVWVALILLATGVIGGVAVAVLRRDGTSSRSLFSLFRPLTGSVILVAPYLPWLPDQFPVVTVLAGPIRWVIWFVLLAETTRRVLTRLSKGHRLEQTLTPMRLAVGLFVATSLLSGLVASRLTGAVLYPGGDEPHYLVMAQSLWRDGDLAIENNHVRGDYLEYYRRTLAPHYLSRGSDGQIYSVHPVGLPVLLAPVYALGGYTAVRAVLIAVSSATIAVLAWWLRRRGQPWDAVLFGSLGVYSSAPFLFFSFAVYPESTAGLAVLLALVLMTRGHNTTWSTGWVGAGCAVAALPWLSTKYAPMAGALGLVALGRIWWPADTPPRRVALRDQWRATTWFVLPCLVSLIGWFGFFVAYWGTVSPAAPYGGNSNTTLDQVPRGALGLLVDQEYGLLPNAPLLLVGLIGLAAMWRAGGSARRLASETTVIATALLVAVGAFHLWWGGSAPPGRPVVSGLALLGLPLAWLYGRPPTDAPSRTIARLLLWFGVGVTGLFVFAQEGLLLGNDRDGTSRLLEYLSPIWSLPSLLPTLITQPPLTAIRVVGVWLAAGAAAYWLLTRRVTHSIGGGMGQSLLTVGLVVGLSVTVPAIAPTQASDRSLERRPRIGFLDQFDADRLPTGIVYAPLEMTDPSVILPRLALEIAQPAMAWETGGNEGSFLYQRRLSLPAGRYAVELYLDEPAPSPATGVLSLMVGRFGEPFAEWPVSLAASAVSPTMAFELATDAGYLGFQASPELRRAQPRLIVRATQVKDAHRRVPHPQVLATLHTDTAAFYFFDHNIWLEREGFWTLGSHRTQLLAAPRRLQRVADEARLPLRCGPIANEVEVSTRSGRRSVTVAAGSQAEAVVPVTDGVTLVELSSASAFIPSERDPASDDRRELGCWITGVIWSPGESLP